MFPVSVLDLPSTYSIDIYFREFEDRLVESRHSSSSTVGVRLDVTITILGSVIDAKLIGRYSCSSVEPQTVLSQHCAIKSMTDELTDGRLSATRNRHFIYLCISMINGCIRLEQYRWDVASRSVITFCHMKSVVCFEYSFQSRATATCPVK